MTNIIILVIILLALMLIFIGLGLYFHSHTEEDALNDDVFLDSDGNHEYYDRSLIEKKEFLRRYPEARGKLRTIGKLFSHKGD